MNFFTYFYIIFLIAVNIIVWFIAIEQLIAVFYKVAPAVSAGIKKQKAVISVIKTFFPNAKSIIDIGSGWGKLVNSMAFEFPKAKIIGIEIFILPYIYSLLKSGNLKNLKFIRADAFKYLDNYPDKFDIGISYLLNSEMQNVENFVNKFKVLIAIDFPLPNINPKEKIKLHKDKHAQHYLYIYKFSEI